MDIAANFIDLSFTHVAYLFIVGFVGGLVSGFIGSGGAFVLTPAMMSMGVPGIVAVASNICHKFPKALVGALKRGKYGQVDWKLGIVMGISAEAGVLYGAQLQQGIKQAFGDAGSNLYVSVAFVIVLGIVGGYVLRDAWKTYRLGQADAAEKVSTLARKVQAINIPGTMMYFKALDAKVSVLFTIPLGFATGMLAATIAVGGFIGVPGMHYVLGAPSLMASATELVIAFVMGLGGTIKFAWSGLVDIRLAMIILAGSLFGIQLGAIGTTYVKPHMIKVVMGTIMVLVLLSRAIVIPVYLSDLQLIGTIEPGLATVLKNVSFAVMIGALAVGAFIILSALLKGMRLHKAELAAAPAAAPVVAFAPTVGLSPVGRLERILLVSDGSEFSAGAISEAIRLAGKCKGRLTALSVVMSDPEIESFGAQLLKQEGERARAHLAQVRAQAVAAGVDCDVVVGQATNVHEAIVEAADEGGADLIVMGRRGKSGLLKTMMGSTTAKVIGYASCSVLVVPRAARVDGGAVVLAVDGSRHSDAAAVAASNFAKHCGKAVTVMSVVHEDFTERRRAEMDGAVQRVTSLLTQDGATARGELVEGRPAQAIVDMARRKNADVIVIGTHGRSGLEKVLIGSVSERVIGQADCAVMVVKAA
jgi:nucleotide-binding universal stress UspA family protein/uncharacterized membrane protein YfcA